MTAAQKARLLVQGATLQGECSGYGLVVRRTDHGYGYGYDVTGERCTLYAHDSADAVRTVERWLTQLADRSTDGAPERRYAPFPGDEKARVVASSVVL